MTSLKKMISITLLVLSMCFANSALANDCFDVSPQLTTLADKYYDLEKTHVLTGENKQQLVLLLEKLEGKWEGEATSMQCAGNKNSPRVTHTSATITAEATLLPNGSLRVRASKFDTRGKINRGERLNILDQSHVFYFDLTDDNQLTFSERFRRQNNNQASRLTEVLYGIKLIDSSLQLKRSYYTNGVLTGSETWALNTQ